jgi:hypothetical protein
MSRSTGLKFITCFSGQKQVLANETMLVKLAYTQVKRLSNQLLLTDCKKELKQLMQLV